MSTSRWSRRATLGLAGAMLLGARSTWAAGSASALYQARTIVTGQRDETRIPGLMRCLPDVLVRVSGDPRLAAHPKLAEFVRTPEAAVAHIGFRDLYANKKLSDEQGTRDRPYEMTVEYDPRKIDAMLAGMGARAWLGDRPRLVVFLAVKHIATSYVLSSTIEAGDLQRQSFADAAWKYGMEVVIPPERALTQAGLTLETLPATPLEKFDALTDKSVGQLPLAGTLSWDRAALGWIARWRIIADGREHRWGIKGVNFDAAFRNAVGGAAQILSGNGDPA